MLVNAGNALYGERWQTNLARDLKLSDARRIRQWLSDDRPIPDGVFNDIAELLTSRKINIDNVLNELNSNQTQG